MKNSLKNRLLRIISIIIFSWLLSCWEVASDEVVTRPQDQLKISVNGEAMAFIVLADKPTTAAKEGAAILSTHLTQISGANFTTVKESSLDPFVVINGTIIPPADYGEKYFILVGKSTLTKYLGATTQELGPGGILIRTYENSLVLLGPDDETPTDPNGTRYAVTTFLENILGCRYLWPGEGGKVVPSQKNITIPLINHQVTPVLQQRRIRMSGKLSKRTKLGLQQLRISENYYQKIYKAALKTDSYDGGWLQWHRLGGTLQLASGHAFGHFWEKHKDNHPEWFALQPDGTRDQSKSPKRARLCISNTSLIDEIAREKIEELRKTSDNSVSIGPNDGGKTSFCLCGACRALDASNVSPLEQNKSLTDRYVYFWNEIAKRVTRVFPTASLTADAYSLYSTPPLFRKLHPNIAIRFVGNTYLNEEKRRNDLNDWTLWAKTAKRIYYRPNVLLAARRQGVPVVYVKKMAYDFKYLAHHSLVGTDFDSIIHHWATQGLNYYVCAKLNWEPGLNIDSLVDDYCRSGFGDGAEFVKQYYKRLELLTNVAAKDKVKHITQHYTPAVMNELKYLLNQALFVTSSDKKANQRVAFLKAGLDYTEVYISAFRMIYQRQTHQKLGKSLTLQGKKILDALDDNWLMSRSIYIKHHLAVNVAIVAWGSWGYFKQFGWSKPSDNFFKATLPIDYH